ncbi:MAG: hypothetical protein QOH76_3954 [Thermoleophilaceae bacterium]|jgi:hypothetical protein|nr:hypothetical protein [Thermoleophilaceae bacterium]
MAVQDIVRAFAVGEMGPESFNAAMADIPGPDLHPWLKLYTQYQNSNWTEDELRQRAKGLLAD